MLGKLLNKVKIGDPLEPIVYLANIIIVLGFVVKSYPQLILATLQSNNHYQIIATGIFIILIVLIPAAFFSAVELYLWQGIVKRKNRRKQERALRELIRNLPPLHRAILGQLMSDPGSRLNTYEPRISSALSDLERLGFIWCGDSIPRAYHVDIACRAFFLENPGLLNE